MIRSQVTTSSPGILTLVLTVVIIGLSAPSFGDETGLIYIKNQDCGTYDFHYYSKVSVCTNDWVTIKNGETEAVTVCKIKSGVSIETGSLYSYESDDPDATQDCHKYAVEAEYQIAGGYIHEVGDTVTYKKNWIGACICW